MAQREFGNDLPNSLFYVRTCLKFNHLILSSPSLSFDSKTPV